ncbi:MAG: hypothetical protein GX963_03390 [Bacteroidales bacterium]|nr:hypothetical protein [Bacteroidales bacterium]
MKPYIKLILSALLILFSLISCNDTEEIPPRIFGCEIKYIDKQNNPIILSPSNGEFVSDTLFKAKLIDPASNSISVKATYLYSSNSLGIQIVDFSEMRNKEKGILNYKIAILHPQVLNNRTDTLDVTYSFNNYNTYLLEQIFYNHTKVNSEEQQRVSLIIEIEK